MPKAADAGGRVLRPPANPNEGPLTHGRRVDTCPPLVLDPPCGTLWFLFSPESPFLTCCRLENLEALWAREGGSGNSWRVQLSGLGRIRELGRNLTLVGAELSLVC